MNEALRRLRELQALDRERRRSEEERAAIPRETARREGELGRLREGIARAHEEGQRAHARVRELENDSADRRERIRKIEVQANMARDTATLMAYQHQVGTLRQEISTAEDEAIGLLDRAAELQAEERRGRETLAEEERTFAAFREAAEQDLRALEARLKDLGEKREGVATGLDAETRAKYEKLLLARDGEALAALEGQTCQGCYVEIPPNDFVRLVRGREIVLCRHCQRILFLEEGAAEEAKGGGKAARP